jgi:hypothetical protein
MSSSSSKSAKLAYHFGTVTTDSVTTDSLQILGKGSVTQGTSMTTGVTLPAPLGVIRTVSSTLATNANISFTASHLSINMDSIIFASITGYTGQGQPSIRVSSQTEGSCVITLENNLAAVLNAPVTIAYQIL